MSGREKWLRNMVDGVKETMWCELCSKQAERDPTKYYTKWCKPKKDGFSFMRIDKVRQHEHWGPHKEIVDALVAHTAYQFRR
jgi:hypothetical protein